MISSASRQFPVMEFQSACPMVCAGKSLEPISTVGSGTEPGCQIFFCGFDASCYHQFAPGKGSKQYLNRTRAQDISGEDIAEVTSGFLGVAYFGHAAAAGGVKNKAPVADSGHFGVKQGNQAMKQAPDCM